MQIYKINGLAEWMPLLIADFKATRRERGEVAQPFVVSHFQAGMKCISDPL
jgi:hypothetical protein